MNALMESFQNLPVLVVGDIILDVYLWGKVDRISPEAPVPVVWKESESAALGGAANVANNLKSLGAKVHLLSICGADTGATLLEKLLQEAGIESTCIRDQGRATPKKTRVMAHNQQLLRIDEENTTDISPATETMLLEAFTRLLESGKTKLVIFQDYNKGMLTAHLIQEMIHTCKDRNIFCAVDPKKKNFLAYKGIDLFKPNLKEINDALPFSIGARQEELEQAGAWLEQELNCRFTMITLSEKGLYLKEKGKAGRIWPTLARNIADVCGAGDTVISIGSLCLACGAEPATTAILANLAGGQVCERVGVVPVDRIQLQEEFEKYEVLKMSSD